MSDLINLNNSELLKKEITFIPYLYKVLLTKDKSVYYFNNWFSTLEIFAYEFGLSDLIPYYSNNLDIKNNSNYDDKVYFLKLWINETTDNNIKNLYENVNNIDEQINLIFRYFADKMKNSDDQKLKIFYPTKFRTNEYNRDNLIKFYLNYYRFKQTEFELGTNLERNNCFDLIFIRNYQYSFSYFNIYHNYIFEFNNSAIEFINEFTNLNKLKSTNLNELSKIKEFINNVDDSKSDLIDFQFKLKELNEIKKLICNKIKNLNRNSKNYETDELSRDDETDETTDSGYIFSNDESSRESSREDNYDNLKQLNKSINESSSESLREDNYENLKQLNRSTNLKSMNCNYNLINEFMNKDCLMLNHSVKINLDDDDQFDLNKQLINRKFIPQSINLEYSKIPNFNLKDQYEEKQLQSSLMCLQSNEQQSNEQSNEQNVIQQSNQQQLKKQENSIKLSKKSQKSKEQQSLNELNLESIYKYRLPSNIAKKYQLNSDQSSQQRNLCEYRLPSNIAKKYQQNSNQFSQHQSSHKYKSPTNLVKLNEKPQKNFNQSSQQRNLSEYRLPSNIAKKYQQNSDQFSQQRNLSEYRLPSNIAKKYQQNSNQLNEQENSQKSRSNNSEQSFSNKLIKIRNSIANLKIFNKDNQNSKNQVKIKQLYPLIDETVDPEKQKQLIKQLKPSLDLVQPKLFVESSFNSKIRKSNKFNYTESHLI